jgi:hypothetical protein
MRDCNTQQRGVGGHPRQRCNRTAAVPQRDAIRPPPQRSLSHRADSHKLVNLCLPPLDRR